MALVLVCHGGHAYLKKPKIFYIMNKQITNDLVKHFEKLKLKPSSLHEPTFKGNELKYLTKCIKTGYVSSVGSYVNKFENKIKKVTKSKYAIAVINGTYALELALRSLNIKKNEEILSPSLTFVATANAITHSGGVPHFVDVNEKNFGVCPDKLKKYLKKISYKSGNKLINKKTKNVIRALVAVHLFGFACEIDKLKKICMKFNIVLVEDAAESIGTFYKKKHLGNFGKLGTISFNGNKTITCGNGGVIITSDKSLAKKIKHLSTTAKKKHKYEYIHDQIAFNMRLSNVNAAIGCAQLEKLNQIIKTKRLNFQRYKKSFKKFKYLTIIQEPKNTRGNYWLICLRLNKYHKIKNYLLSRLNKKNINCRAIWKPLHKLNIYKKIQRDDLTSTNLLYDTVINIPSSPSLKI